MAKVKAILWKWSKTSEGNPIKLRVNHGNEKRYYSIKDGGRSLYSSPGEFEKKSANTRTALGKLLENEESKALRAIKEPFNWEGFESGYLGTSPEDFYHYFQKYLDRLMEAHRIGTYLSYHNALQAWRKFRPIVDPLEVLTLLPQFEATIAGKSTRGFYLRATRAVYNNLRNTSLNSLPEWKYIIKSKVATHKGQAMNANELKAFIKAKGTPEQTEAKRIWLMSFYGSGMNLADLLELRHTDLRGDRIIYTRAKTKRTKDETIEIPLTRELKELIPSGLGYIIPFDRTGTPLQVKKRAQGFLKNVNRRLKALCKANGIPAVTTYWARHTFASLLKDHGTSIALIRELLGHSDIKTTENYLGRFDFDKKQKATSKIFKLQA